MTTGLTTLESKSLDAPDETRPFSHGKLDVVNIGGTVVGRSTFEPGWKWSECVKPIAGTDNCQATHLGYMISGRMHVVMQDGTETELGPGDAAVIPAGHDAWIVGDETCIFLDFMGAAQYAKR